MRYFKLIMITLLSFGGITSSFAAQAELFVQVAPQVPTPSALTTHIDISDPSGNNALDADEIIAVTVSVKNDGPGVAANVLVSLDDTDNSLPKITVSDAVHLGDIPASESRQAKFKLQATRTIGNGKLHLLVRVFEQQGFDANDLQIVMDTRAFVPPEFTLVDLGIDDQNWDGMIEPMEVTELTARIANTSKSAAHGVKAEVKFGKNVFAAMEGKRSFHIGDLSPGESHDLNFAFVTNRRILKGEAIPIMIKVFEAASGQTFSLPITLTMDTASQPIRQVIASSNEPEEIKVQPPEELAIDIEQDIPLGLLASPDDIALIIGNRNYRRQGLPRVEYAHRDLEVMKEYLVKTFGFNPQRIVVEKDASKGTFEQLFGTHQQPRGKLADLVAQDGSSRVFVYYTGHGAPDLDSGDSFFLPVDADPDYIAATGYSLSLFYGNLKQIKARQMIVVIDACFSGRTPAGLLFANSSPAMLKVRETPSNLKRGVVLTSSRSTEVSSWYPAKKHSMFTYFFLKGIQGAADRDQNRIITAGELDTWLNGKVPYWARRIAGRSQNPFMEGDKNIPLVHLREMENKQ